MSTQWFGDPKGARHCPAEPKHSGHRPGQLLGFHVNHAGWAGSGQCPPTGTSAKALQACNLLRLFRFPSPSELEGENTPSRAGSRQPALWQEPENRSNSNMPDKGDPCVTFAHTRLTKKWTFSFLPGYQGPSCCLGLKEEGLTVMESHALGGDPEHGRQEVLRGKMTTLWHEAPPHLEREARVCQGSNQEFSAEEQSHSNLGKWE